MSLAEYARHRGVSGAAVTYAIRDGRISTTTDHRGKRVIDSEAADQQWNANTAHDKRRNTAEAPAGIAPPEPPMIQTLAAAPQGDQIGFDRQALGLPEKPDVTGDGADNTYARARANKEHFLAKQAELDYLESAGKLVDVATIQKTWTAVATTVRTKVLGIPSKARQRIPDLTNEQYLVLEKLAREALEDLSEGEQ